MSKVKCEMPECVRDKILEGMRIYKILIPIWFSLTVSGALGVHIFQGLHILSLTTLFFAYTLSCAASCCLQCVLWFRLVLMFWKAKHGKPVKMYKVKKSKGLPIKLKEQWEAGESVYYVWIGVNDKFYFTI